MSGKWKFTLEQPHNRPEMKFIATKTVQVTLSTQQKNFYKRMLLKRMDKGERMMHCLKFLSFQNHRLGCVYRISIVYSLYVDPKHTCDIFSRSLHHCCAIWHELISFWRIRNFCYKGNHFGTCFKQSLGSCTSLHVSLWRYTTFFWMYDLLGGFKKMKILPKTQTIMKIMSPILFCCLSWVFTLQISRFLTKRTILWGHNGRYYGHTLCMQHEWHYL